MAPKSNHLLAVEELYSIKQGTMTAAEFHSKVYKSARLCNFPCKKAEKRAVRDVIYLGLSSQKVRDKCINSFNSKEEVIIKFLMKHLEIEDSNSHHRSLSQMASTTGVNYACYDHRQNRGNKHNKNSKNGKPPG